MFWITESIMPTSKPATPRRPSPTSCPATASSTASAAGRTRRPFRHPIYAARARAAGRMRTTLRHRGPALRPGGRKRLRRQQPKRLAAQPRDPTGAPRPTRTPSQHPACAARARRRRRRRRSGRPAASLGRSRRPYPYTAPLHARGRTDRGRRGAVRLGLRRPPHADAAPPRGAAGRRGGRSRCGRGRGPGSGVSSAVRSGGRSPRPPSGPRARRCGGPSAPRGPRPRRGPPRGSSERRSARRR